MVRKQTRKKSYTKVIDEQYTLAKKRDGGVIKIEAWQDAERNVIKYNIAYINHALFQGDNGRVIGYGNAHDYHHKHYFGDISPIDDFISYEKLVERFENDIKEYIK